MRALAAMLVLALLFLQYQYWWGRGGRADVERLRAEISAQHAEIERLRARNSTLAAEVADLKEGMDAIEELARSEIGMIRQGEVFLQLIEPRAEAAPAAGSAAASPP